MSRHGASKDRSLAKSSARTTLRIVGALVGVLIFFFVIQTELGYNLYDPAFYSKNKSLLISAFLTTLLYTAIVIPLGMAIGFLTGWGRVTKYKFLAYPATVYVDLVRGIPPIVLILFAFFFGPLILPGVMDPTQAGRFFGAVALSLHTGAYQAEIFRAGFQSIPRGQVEAATAVGLSKGQTMTGIVLPQTFRLVLPALGNELATVLKDTSLLGAIGILDLFGTARSQAQYATIYQGGLGVFTWWTVVAILYFVLTFALTRSLQLIERRSAVPGLGSVSV